jgi:formylglycine-generating enzyme required for sulfatase activity
VCGMTSMRRGFVVLWVAVATTCSASAGCEKARRDQTPDPIPLKDARVVAADTRLDADIDARDDGPEPLVPPPPPTVKRNGKGDCSVEYAPRPTRDPNPLCKIAGGSFMMGSADPKAEANERPVRKVTLTPYFIDQFEVTNAQVAHFLNAVGNQCANGRNGKCFGINAISSGAPFISNDNGRFRARPGFERHPIYSASIEGAERYCAWVGKRLPTEAEWEFAARHDPKTNMDYRWPWGDTFYPKRAACDEAVCSDGFDLMKGKNASEEAPVGTFDGTHGFGDGSSPWGVHDMAGNVSEIMADVTDAYATPYPDCAACIDPVMMKVGSNTYHVTRGPSGSVTYNAGIATRGGGTGTIEGFRCAFR